MELDLEIIDYDVHGAAYREGKVVDGAFLDTVVRRRPDGDAMALRIDLAALDADERAELFAAFTEIEAIVSKHAHKHFARQASDPKALDKKIAAAAQASKELAQLEAAISERKALLEAGP